MRLKEKIEAAVFRRLLEHLDSRKDAQNIDLMNLAGFCRNCLSKWYMAAAAGAGAGGRLRPGPGACLRHALRAVEGKIPDARPRRSSWRPLKKQPELAGAALHAVSTGARRAGSGCR